MQEILRFVAGGLVVSLFAVLGDVVKPKSFAGLFGAAPSVALATLTLTVVAHGKEYAATEGRSLIAGAIALGIYAAVCSYLMMRRSASQIPNEIPNHSTIAVGVVACSARQRR